MQVSRVLVVDGDRATRDALVTCLKFVGVEAHGAACETSARFWLNSGVPDLLVLTDELAEGLADREFARFVGARFPVMLLTRENAARRPAPSYPFDEQLRWPMPVSRVVERIESLIDQRRKTGAVRLTFGKLTLDVPEARAEAGGRALPLGPTEARILAFLMGAPDRVFSRRQLLQRLWPSNVRVAERTVDVHIRRLRAVLEELDCAEYIQTVRGAGYRFSRQVA